MSRPADWPDLAGAYLLEAEFDAVPDRSVELVGTLVITGAGGPGGALAARVDAVLSTPGGPVAVSSVRDIAVTAEHGLHFTLALPPELVPDLRRDRAGAAAARGARGAWAFWGMLPAGAVVGPFAAAGRHDVAGARTPGGGAVTLGPGSWYLTAQASADLPAVRPPRGRRR